MTTSQTDVADELRAWAQSVYPLGPSSSCSSGGRAAGSPGRATHGPSKRRVRSPPEPRYQADLAEIPDLIGSLTGAEQSFLLWVASKGIDTPNQTR